MAQELQKKSKLMEEFAAGIEPEEEEVVEENLPTALVTVYEYDSMSGQLPVQISEINDAGKGIGTVNVAVWTEEDQSDLQWMQAEQQEDGTFWMNIDVPEFNYKTGGSTILMFIWSMRTATRILSEVRSALYTKSRNSRRCVWKLIRDLRKYMISFMDNVPYEEWGAYLSGLLEEYGICDGIVADLGCGTGTMTEYLAEKGYDMIGIDASEEMLEIAQEKKEKSGHEILYLLQDMREFELYGTVRAIVSICDSINYITEPDDLKQVFHWADNYLDPDGVFIFDFNTEYKYREILGDQTIAENRETCSFIWDNYYYEEERINEI